MLQDVEPCIIALRIRKAVDTRFNICCSTNVAAVVQQMLNSLSCHVECWNMPFNTLNVVERC